MKVRSGRLSLADQGGFLSLLLHRRFFFFLISAGNQTLCAGVSLVSPFFLRFKGGNRKSLSYVARAEFVPFPESFPILNLAAPG